MGRGRYNLELITKYSHSIYIKIEKKEFDSKKKLLKNFFIASLTLETYKIISQVKMVQLKNYKQQKKVKLILLK